jgi:hypothetical protein
MKPPESDDEYVHYCTNCSGRVNPQDKSARIAVLTQVNSLKKLLFHRNTQP